MHYHRLVSALLAICILGMVVSGCGTDKGDPSEEGSSFETPAPTETPAPPSEPPTNGKVIMLDPGHSATTTTEMEPIGPGATKLKQADTDGTHGNASGLMEYQLVLQICQKLRDQLTSEGYTVLMTREDNETAVTCRERAETANFAGADLFIRIHADGSTDPGRTGAQTICINPDNPYHPELYPESRSLSENIILSYCQETGIENRGIWETDTMTGNNWAQMPATLLELGFMTNAEEDLKMASEDFQVRMVRGIVNGINNYFAGVAAAEVSAGADMYNARNEEFR